MVTETELISRGWTADIIEQYLPKPMIQAGVKVWSVQEVADAEAEFCRDVEDPNMFGGLI